jgi:hypothetical protein
MDDNYIIEFLNGGCFTLSRKLNELYGYEIYHIFRYEKDDDDNGFVHSVVKIGDDKFLDITGINNSTNLITYWYEELGTISQCTEIFLINDKLINIISKIRKTKITFARECTQFDILKYDLINHHKAINWDYNCKLDLNETCNKMKLCYEPIK